MSKKILIIEDDRFLRELISRKLSSEGYETAEAADGESGIAAVKKFRPNLVLLDLILPGIDGFEVLERIKKDKGTNSVLVIILSNLGQKEDIEKGIRLGATDYLIKAHFTPSEILDKIAALFRQE